MRRMLLALLSTGLVFAASLLLWPPQARRAATLPGQSAVVPMEVVWLAPQQAAGAQKTKGRQGRAAGVPAAAGGQNAEQAQAGESNMPAILSDGDSYDDFVSVAQASDGTLYAAYAAYYDGHDQIRVHRRLPSGQWSTRPSLPGRRSDHGTRARSVGE